MRRSAQLLWFEGVGTATLNLLQGVLDALNVIAHPGLSKLSSTIHPDTSGFASLLQQQVDRTLSSCSSQQAAVLLGPVDRSAAKLHHDVSRQKLG